MFLLLLVFVLILIFGNIDYCCYYRESHRESFTSEICGRTYLNRIEIWKNVKNKHGIKKALELFPQTYILPDEIDSLLVDPNHHFILKKLWSSLRKGVSLYDNKDSIKKDYKNYDLAQIFIKNPLLINGFKFDIRFFMVSKCNVGNFLYVKGYNVYTNQKYDYNSMDRKTKINQSFTKDDHYDSNDLERQFKDLCNRYNFNYNEIIHKIADKLKYVLSATPELCCKEDKDKYNVYGVDIELLDNFDPMIIEINSTPSLKFNEKWKKNLISDLQADIQQSDFSSLNWIKL